VRLNSPGGDYFDGVAIANALARHPATVTVHVDGLAASAASVIAMAGDKVVMHPGAQMMIHDALTMTIGNASRARQDPHPARLRQRRTSPPCTPPARAATADEWRTAMLAETWYTAERGGHRAGARPRGARPRARPERRPPWAAVLQAFRTSTVDTHHLPAHGRGSHTRRQLPGAGNLSELFSSAIREATL
jgi:hypothetical protein